MLIDVFEISQYLIIESCPEGYALKSGDLPGWGSDLGERLYLSRQQCADKCSKHRDCLSFEHSKTTNLCNLNRIAEPTEGPFEDFAFCVKQKGKNFFVILVKIWITLDTKQVIIRSIMKIN